ncbi:asparagine synthase (glutamine-hydrolyzing) [Pseudomonas fuscovaginae UPB0736]|uniref:asparagine synthase (glutamine-hydrolyzing) n=1 Tax=Pseudomonas asplenii TaxID=53407 RepID=UPI00058F4B20|nr:asparagine synthase (glutamine-hydrolyzing) [Pseudomonas fuscovaginae]UUQ63729.2 asparagine synthase (glutamine-hydrolyzing) [Pseudomonas fuscovaginae UPB0736]
MCGICGVFVAQGGASVSEALIISMRDSLRHRGPDASGLWIDASRRLGLGHRRLSIVDLDEASTQPMSDAGQSVVVVFNGEIYNHMAMRRELEVAGHRFRTAHSDTEVLVHGYRAWGWEGLLQRLRGMFAIALWDNQQRILYLGRDRVGIKPLYLHASGGRLLFASEIKAILQVPDVVRDIDPIAMYHYLSGMVAPAPLTMFSGIQKLPAGCYLQFVDGGRMEFKRYWYPALNSPALPASRDEAVRRIRDTFDASVVEHMAADVPVGVLLSGGVDSSSLLAGMAAHASGPVHSFSVGYDGFPEMDEREHARDMARHFGAEHHEISVTQNSFEESWADILYQQDEPLADWVCVPLYHVSKLAAGQVKAVLVGEGADELFAGYSGYLRYLKLHQRFWQPYRMLPRTVRQGAGWLARQAGRDGLSHASGLDFLIRASSDKECFWGGAATFWEIQKSALLNKGVIDFSAGSGPLDDSLLRVADSNVVMAAAAAMLPAGDIEQLRRMTQLELSYRLPELLLMRVDKMTMAHSIEARVPFLDHRLVEAAYAMPADWKLDGGRTKSLFKDAVRGLIPDRVIDRPKVGFGAPVAHWLRGEFGRRVEHEINQCALFKRGWFNLGYIRELFDAHRSGRGDYGTNLWALYNLAGWYDCWIDAPNARGGR